MSFAPEDDNGWQGWTSALCADALDTVGARAQCLPPDIRLVDASLTLIGRAFPVMSIPATDPVPARPYTGLFAALDEVGAAEVFVFATGGSDAAGVWGELITTACKAKGVAGAVTDGLIRDVQRIQESHFPVCARGATPYDSKGRIDVISHAVPVTIGGVLIRRGDVIVADADGCCVVPREHEEAVRLVVSSKSQTENLFRKAVADGLPASKAFAEYGVL